MKTMYLYVILLINVVSFSQNQAANFSAIDSLSFIADKFVGNDGIGYSYFIRDNVLIKKSATENFEYKNLTKGEITYVDIHNPLKIILFYENFNTIITLDNQLNEAEKINFSQLETPIVAAATGMAAQNQFWIYNNLTQKIGVYNYLRNIYKDLTQSFDGNLIYYQSDFNNFQWIDDKLNWYSCSIFGNIKNLGKVNTFKQLQFVSDTSYFYSLDNKMYYKTLQSDKALNINIKQKSFISFFYKDQILSIFTNEGITNYKIILP